MQQVSSPVFNQNGRWQKKKSEVEEEEDLKQEENVLKEEEDQIYQITVFLDCLHTFSESSVNLI